MAGLDDRDVAAAIRIVAIAASPAAQTAGELSRRTLLAALGGLIAADSWVWLSSSGSELFAENGEGDFVHDGWRDDAEREIALTALKQCPLNLVLAASAERQENRAQGYTRLGGELLNVDGAAQSTPPWRRAGLRDVLITIYPLASGGYSVAGFCRRSGDPFTDRERSLLHCVFQNVPWLHGEAPLQAGAKLGGLLSRREREVLELLLEGHARKEVAARLNLSTHTVADYLKVIYKKLGVTSRAALLAKFIQNS